MMGELPSIVAVDGGSTPRPGRARTRNGTKTVASPRGPPYLELSLGLGLRGRESSS